MQDRPAPLAGIRVVDIATFVAAPYAASILGEFGAEVIKVEQPGEGDPLRRFGSPSARAGDTYCWLSEGRNKRSITLDLRKERGKELFRELVAGADVVCENFRPGTLEKWGIGYEALQAVNPRLIMLRISGYGQTGPYRDRPGFARIAHAFSGLAHLTGMPGGPPLTPGSTSLADYVSGAYGAIGVLLALRSRDQTGLGQSIDLALYEPIFRMLDDLAPAFAALGTTRGRLGTGTTNACPHGHFQAADGGWVAIACTSDKMFARLAAIMGRPGLAADDVYGRAAVRIANSAAVDKLTADFVASMPTDALIEACVAGEVPCARVNTIADIFADPQFQARESLVTRRDETLGDVVVPGPLPRLSETPGRIDSLGPLLGAGNAEVYGTLLGLSEAEIATLKADGVI